MIKAGIIGCGTIGDVIADAIAHRFSDAIELSGVCDIDREKADRLLVTLKMKASILDRKGLIQKTHAEMWPYH